MSRDKAYFRLTLITSSLLILPKYVSSWQYIEIAMEVLLGSLSVPGSNLHFVLKLLLDERLSTACHCEYAAELVHEPILLPTSKKWATFSSGVPTSTPWPRFKICRVPSADFAVSWTRFVMVSFEPNNTPGSMFP